MRLHLIWTTGVLCVAGLYSQATAAPASMPPNAFLESPVHSVKELQQQLNNNGRVRDRYRRHFAMTDQELREFFATFRLVQLPRDQSFDVYNVPETGLLRAKRRSLKAGTWVFMDRVGAPVLMRICGNPLTRGPKKPFAAPVLSDTVRPDALIVTMPTAFEEAKQDLIVEVIEPDPLPELVIVPQPEVVPVVPEDTPPVLRGEVKAVASIPSVPLAILPWLIVPSVGIPSFGGGPSRPQPAVPEPNSLLALGCAAIGYGGLRRRKASR